MKGEKMKPQALLEKAKTLDESMSHKMRMLSNSRYADNRLIWGNQVYDLNPKSEEQLLEKLRVPAPYWNRIDPELKTITANHLLRTHDREVMVHSVENGGKTIVGFQSPTSPLLSMERAMNVILDSVPEDGWEIKNGDFSGSLCRVSIVTPRKENVKKNDIVQFGVNAWLSPIGDHVPKVEDFALRLVCTNGMVIPETRPRRGSWGRNAEDVYQKLSEAVDDIFKRMDNQEVVERFREMAAHKLETDEDIVKEMETLFKEYSIPKELRGRAWDIFHAEGDFSRWGAVNALTRLANENDLSLEEIQNLQSWAGAYSIKPHCQTCGHVLSVN
jgi:hypothetical protein